MKILGIDTTTRFLSLALYDNGRLYEYNLEVGRRLSLLIAQTLARVLTVLGWRVEDVDYFACGLGPGSFTGIRIGLATMKGFAWSVKKPIVGVSSLDLIARNVQVGDRPIVPMVDAKRQLVYCSMYEIKKATLKRRAPYMLLTVEELLKKIKPDSIILGDAVALYKRDILTSVKGISILEKDYWYPQGRCVIALALEKIRDKKIYTPAEINPIYIYPKECQVRQSLRR